MSVTTTDHRPFHTAAHKRSISARTLDSVLENALGNTPSSRPSSASTQSSFSTAYTTLETGKCFRYYLPHISTDQEAVYTRTDSYACNISPVAPFTSRPPVHYGRFYQYMPELSGEKDDVYTDGRNVMYDMLRGPGRLDDQPEQKVWGIFKRIDFCAVPVDDRSTLSYIGPTDFPCRPGHSIRGSAGVRVDSSSHRGGERCGTDVVVSADREGKAKWTEEKHKRSVSLIGMSEKMSEMLRKMHLMKKKVK